MPPLDLSVPFLTEVKCSPEYGTSEDLEDGRLAKPRSQWYPSQNSTGCAQAPRQAFPVLFKPPH